MRYVMWELNLKAHPLMSRASAAAAGGFDTLTLSWREFRKAGMSVDGIASLLRTVRDQGLDLDFLDGMTSWAPIRFAHDPNGFMAAAFDFGIDDAFDLCERTGVRNIVAIAGFEQHALPRSQQIDCFARFCEAAHERGLSVHLEAMPILAGGLPTLKDAWDIVHHAAQPNGMLMLDTWHFMRSGADFDLLRQIPRGSIKHVQLVDGSAMASPDGLREDAFNHRELPGRGALPLAYLLRLLRQTQDIESIGPEAITPRLDRLDPLSVGVEAGETTEALAYAAGFPTRRFDSQRAT